MIKRNDFNFGILVEGTYSIAQESGAIYINSDMIGSGLTYSGGLLEGIIISSSQETGTLISFEKSNIYNTASSPATTNITEDLTDAKLGIVQKIYHNNSTPPTVPGTWVLMGDGIYINSALNVIYAEWCGGTRVEYWIIQEQ
jgi:hypothetical protein